MSRFTIILSAFIVTGCNTEVNSDIVQNLQKKESSVSKEIDLELKFRNGVRISINTAISDFRDLSTKTIQGFREQTAGAVSLFTAEILNNERFYAAGGAGMALRLGDEEHLRALKITGLKAEKELLENTLSLKFTAMETLRAIDEPSSISKIEILLKKFRQQQNTGISYINKHRALVFPNRNDVSLSSEIRNYEDSSNISMNIDDKNQRANLLNTNSSIILNYIPSNLIGIWVQSSFSCAQINKEDGVELLNFTRNSINFNEGGVEVENVSRTGIIVKVTGRFRYIDQDDAYVASIRLQGNRLVLTDAFVNGMSYVKCR